MLSHQVCLGDVNPLTSSKAFQSHTHQHQLKLKRSTRKCPYTLRTVSRRSPQRRHWNNISAGLIEHRSFPISWGGTSAAFFLHSPVLQAINAGLFFLGKFLKPLSTSAPSSFTPAVMFAPSISLFTPFDSSMARAADPWLSLRPQTGLQYGSQVSQSPDPLRMMA